MRRFARPAFERYDSEYVHRGASLSRRLDGPLSRWISASQVQRLAVGADVQRPAPSIAGLVKRTDARLVSWRYG